MKTPEIGHQRHSDIIFVNFEPISLLFLVFIVDFERLNVCRIARIIVTSQ